MSKTETFLFSALQSLMTIVIGMGSLLLPTSVIWLVENDPTVQWISTFRTSADIWLLGHGVTIEFAAGRLFGTDIPAFDFSLIPIGLSILLGLLIFRIGRRLATAPVAWPGWLGALLAYGGFSLSLTVFAASPTASATDWQVALFPALFMATALALGTLTGNPIEIDQIGIEALERRKFREWSQKNFANLGWALRALCGPALRAGTAVVLMLTAAAGLALAILVGFNWILITQLYEAVRVTVLGGIVVTAAQLAILPNLAVYGASWFTGVGFSIGTGSLISPLGTATGPMPALPILGALPVGQLSFGMIALVVPLVSAFLATVMIRKRAADIRFEFASAWSAAISLGLSIAAVAAIEIGILVFLASGSAGPGRLAMVGANPLLVAGALFVETAVVSILAAFYSARPDAPDHELLKTLKR